MGRTSHALAVDGRVWLTDPIDADGVEERIRSLGEPAGVIQLLDRHKRDGAALAARLGVPLHVVPSSLPGTPFLPAGAAGPLVEGGRRSGGRSGGSSSAPTRSARSRSSAQATSPPACTRSSGSSVPARSPGSGSSTCSSGTERESTERRSRPRRRGRARGEAARIPRWL